MGAMSAIKAGYGLWGSGTSSGTNVTGTPKIGTTLTEVSLTGADIIYSITFDAVGNTDQCTLNLETGAVTQDVGTANVIRRAGEVDNLAAIDFEGADLPTALKVHAFLITTGTIAGLPTIAFSNAQFPDITMLSDQKLQWSSLAAVTSPGTVTITFDNEDDAVTIIVAGRTTP